MLSSYNGIILAIKNDTVPRKFLSIWTLNTLLNKPQVKEEITRELTYF